MTMQNTTPALIFRNCQGQIFTKCQLTSVPPVMGRIVLGGTGGDGDKPFSGTGGDGNKPLQVWGGIGMNLCSHTALYREFTK